MNNINILITSLGGDIGGNTLNILRQQKEKELFIVGTDINENNYSVGDVDKFYKVPRTKDPEFGSKMLQIIEKYKINFVIPMSEVEIIWFNENRAFFDHLNVEIIINNRNIINTFLNKLETSLELKKINILTPTTLLFNEYVGQLDFPLIVKSNYSIYGKDLFIVRNQSQLDYLKLDIKDHCKYIIQQYIGNINDEFTTTVFKNLDKLEVITFKRQLTGGMTSYAVIHNVKILEEYAKKIATVFHLEGSLNIQSRKIGNQFYIFEINPRFSSTIFIRNHFGFQDLLWSMNARKPAPIFKLKDQRVSHSGQAILGYKYKFLNSPSHTY